MSVAFLITTLIVVATPGTGALYTIAAGISRGKRASLIAAVGCTLGILPHMIAAIAGLAAVLYSSSLAFQSLKYLGVVYLLYLAVKTYRDRSELTVQTTVEARSAGRVIGHAILINVLNPKLTVFFFAFLPQFVDPGGPNATLRMIGLSSVFMAVTLIVFAGYGLFAATVRRQVITRPRVVTWMRRLFAGSYVVLAGRLAVTQK